MFFSYHFLDSFQTKTSVIENMIQCKTKMKIIVFLLFIHYLKKITFVSIFFLN